MVVCHGTFLSPESEYNVQTYGIYADFSLGARIYQDVEDTLKDLEIGILGKLLSVYVLPSLHFDLFDLSPFDLSDDSDPPLQ